jgi:hypothetical protein
VSTERRRYAEDVQATYHLHFTDGRGRLRGAWTPTPAAATLTLIVGRSPAARVSARRDGPPTVGRAALAPSLRGGLIDLAVDAVDCACVTSHAVASV